MIRRALSLHTVFWTTYCCCLGAVSSWLVLVERSVRPATTTTTAWRTSLADDTRPHTTARIHACSASQLQQYLYATPKHTNNNNNKTVHTADHALSNTSSVLLDLIATANIAASELPDIHEAIAAACLQHNVVYAAAAGVKEHNDTANNNNNNNKNNSIPGTTGRVLLLQRTSMDVADGANDSINNNHKIDLLKNAISMQLDAIASSRLGGDGDHQCFQQQPMLVCVEQSVAKQSPPHNATRNSMPHGTTMMMMMCVQREVDMYELRVPLASYQTNNKTGNTNIYQNNNNEQDPFVPTLQLELDGAMVTTPATHMPISGHDGDEKDASFWDTSTVLVWDRLVSPDLRKRLRHVVLGTSGNASTEMNHETEAWNDVQQGPDPRRWVRGGLVDVAESQDKESSLSSCALSGWGLTEDAVMELCFEHHDALQDFEMILSELLADFVVTRLPEAVMGSHVTPLTANAPTAGDVFDYHIDADPMLTPPSPWTDVFGRYPNRCRGKPRFMSCLVYINDEWDAVDWGAPTRFLDVATNAHYDVEPLPGRVVLMDQDITHTVVAPTTAAGKRPRYSLVWKLILHPKRPDQDMTYLAGNAAREARWPTPVLFGSAAQDGSNDDDTIL